MRLDMLEDLAVHLDGFHWRPSLDGTASLMENCGSCQSRIVLPDGTQANPLTGGGGLVYPVPYHNAQRNLMSLPVIVYHFTTIGNLGMIRAQGLTRGRVELSHDPQDYANAISLTTSPLPVGLGLDLGPD